jgi:flagellar export protein FliJ
MKKFLFPLERVRAWRRLCWDREEGKLEQLLQELHRLESRQLQLHAEAEERARGIVARQELHFSDLESLDQLRRYLAEEDRRLTQKREQAKAAIEAQRRAVLTARRQYEAVEKLRERQYQSWELDRVRDEESRIGELTLARWKRKEVRPSDGT